MDVVLAIRTNKLKSCTRQVYIFMFTKQLGTIIIIDSADEYRKQLNKFWTIHKIAIKQGKIVNISLKRHSLSNFNEIIKYTIYLPTLQFFFEINIIIYESSKKLDFCHFLTNFSHCLSLLTCNIHSDNKSPNSKFLKIILYPCTVLIDKI